MAALLALTGSNVQAQGKNDQSNGRGVDSVEIMPAEVGVEVGHQVSFSAVGKDVSGHRVSKKPTLWFTMPTDVATAHVTKLPPSLFACSVVIVGAGSE